MSEQRVRRSCSRNEAASPEETGNRSLQPPDLRLVTVLSKAEWTRIRDQLNHVSKDEERVKETMKQREALHLQSKEVVKLWSNTIAGQRQKKLEAKKIREELEEENRKLIDAEEAKYQEEKRREAVKKAKQQLYYQTDRVKGLHGALLLTEVLKEREAQIQLKHRIQTDRKHRDKEFTERLKMMEEEAEKKQQEKTLQEKLRRRTAAEELKNQIKDKELVKEQQKLEDRKEAEFYLWEKRHDEGKQEEVKRKMMLDHQEHVKNKDIIRATEEQQQQADDALRNLFIAAKDKMRKLRTEKEKDMFSEAQRRREAVGMKLQQQQQQQESEELRILRAAAEQEEKHNQRQREEQQRRAAMLESIAAHRELVREEQQQENMRKHQEAAESLHNKREADRKFTEKQQEKNQKRRQEGRRIQEFNSDQLAARSLEQVQLRREDQVLDLKTREVLAEEEAQFQEYSRQVMEAAAQTQRNVFPLCKAAREGVGGGLGPSVSGIRPSYLVQDYTGAQMPRYGSDVTRNIKELHGPPDMESAKQRLGFTW